MKTLSTKRADKTLPVLIKELDAVFSEWVRRKESDEHGMVTCFVTGARIRWQDADAAHFIPRSQMATRYNEMNVHAATRFSNRLDDDHTSAYTKAMIEKYSPEEIAQLINTGSSLRKFHRWELEELIAYYKSENRLKK